MKGNHEQRNGKRLLHMHFIWSDDYVYLCIHFIYTLLSPLIRAQVAYNNTSPSSILSSQ